MSARISAAELRQRMAGKEQFQLVDVRTPVEYAAGHIACATNIPMEQLESRMKDLSATAQVVLVCQGGQRATTAASWICESKEVLILEGGTGAWRAAGYPMVESGAASRWALERQIRFGAGTLVLVATLLARFENSAWLYFAVFVAAGQIFAAITNVCPMGMGLSRMPWNRPRQKSAADNTSAPCCSQ